MAKSKIISGKAISAKATRGLNIGSMVLASDNSGARVVRITGVKHGKSTKKRQQYAKLADWVKVSVRAGKPDMKGQVFDAVVIRQRKPCRRLTGERICFEDNAVALLKDDKGNPKGTQIKGPVAREVQERWQQVAKIAQFVL
ncbi:MAG: uL14 family ribosomal protein [Nanoarchaeota archaeon]|nr:uL14 family ribosomal protein [Nanoarchaeota archaeon]MBU1051629.1 uL14 family ribosomal protein [Nanoarchaeota archaeon]MBU1988831.1 uL14 family ribosomal protein [Nanoarchaeota archaeon]